MKCAKCGKEINFDSALRCSFCGRDYCTECAEHMVMCDCYGDLAYYH